MKGASKLLSAVAVVALFIFPLSSFAETLYEQTVADEFVPVAGTQARQNFGDNATCGTQFTGSVKYATVRFKTDLSTGSSDWRVQFQTNFGSTLTTFSSATTTIANSTTAQDVTFTFPTAVNLVSDCVSTFATDAVWRPQLDRTAGTAGQILAGSATSTIAHAVCVNSCAPVLDLYYILRDDGMQNTSTRIVTQDSPDLGETTSSAGVTFEYTFYYNDVTTPTLTEYCVEINDATLSQNLDAVCSTITASGLNNASLFSPLTTGHTYTWRPYLTATSTTDGRVYGTAGWFNVVSAPVNQSIIPPTNATSTSALQGWFTGVQSTILGVPPWSYWVQLRTIMLTSADSLTGTSTVPSFTFPIGTASSSIHFSQTLFDKTKMEAFIPSSAWSAGKVLMAGILYVLFALMIYHEVDRRFSKHHA